MAKQSLSVSIVIPNWNGENLLRKNLPFVLAATKNAEIILSDDASEDGSADFVRETYPSVIIVESRVRHGFAGNVNSGVKRATGDIVVLINTDVRPETGFLEPLLSAFADGSVAAVGCLEKSHEGAGTVLRGRGVARWERGFLIHSRGEVDATDTAWVAGGSAAYRRSVWNMLGGMDTIYNPFYWEDIDLSYQIRKAGLSLRFERKSVVHHYHEEGSIRSAFTPDDVKRIAFRNQFLFLWKNISDTDIRLEHAFWTPVRLFQALLRADRNFLTGFVLAVFMLPSAVKRHVVASRHWKLKDREIFSS